ncbi:hypothetical protein BB561_003131 [Smittium simulii]|uniref:Uncharacterized protein n=1 Tax=Smittium simulii TaxID=133385 RepID=A0A2T9YMS8_9FUNG|nr:hypothetical protein BB561_003131 [Smittium simulii]
MARIPRFHRGGRGSIPRIGVGSVAQWTRRLTTNQEIPDDTTGNNQNNTKGDSIFCNITQLYYQYDNIITWEEVTIALKATPNNKAPGIDTILSQIWKIVQQKANPTTNFSKLIFKLINLLYKNNNIPEQCKSRIFSYV